MESKGIKCRRIKNLDEMGRKKEYLICKPEKNSYTRTVEINGKKIFQTNNNISLRDKNYHQKKIKNQISSFGFNQSIVRVPYSSRVKIRKKDY